jgi:16S rRNA (uracil1498-N3)-methyltransferase
VSRYNRSSLKLAGEKLVSRLTRWRRIVTEAAEQSGRTAIPDVQWRPHLDKIERPGSLFCLHPEADTPWKTVKEQICRSELASFAIGPEGGWSGHDLDILANLGFQRISFGPRILRTETAAPALLAAVQSLMD